MISKKIENALNNQVELEGASSHYYLAMASWAEIKGYNGVCQFLYRHAEEERAHMLKLMRYINERGGHAEVPSMTRPPKDYNNLNSVFEHILEHEVSVSGEINHLIELCLKEKDHTTNNFLQWYVSEQIEEEALAKHILDKLNLIGNDKGGLYLFDRDLDSMATQPDAHK